MKRLFTSFVAILLVALTSFAQDGGSKIKFTESEFDFGKKPVGTPVTHEFEFVNVGTSPLVLENVRASCGCTTPQWPKEPIAPGQKATISATYNMGHAGAFNKSVTVTTKDGETIVLYIKGDAFDPNPPAEMPVIVEPSPAPQMIYAQPEPVVVEQPASQPVKVVAPPAPVQVVTPAPVPEEVAPKVTEKSKSEKTKKVKKNKRTAVITE
ncbi:MAG: DUF1573 domain-containing protein [Chitinophagales bacterium]|nr:DUF1573 domain-containing protein [Chitinophagales bacterium]